MEDENNQEENYISDAKIAKIKNLKMFRNMSHEEIRAYFKNRNPKVPKPPENIMVSEGSDIPEEIEYNSEKYDKKYKSYLQRYRKEYDADMNDANDVQAVESLVRLVIQAEVIDENIRRVQSAKNLDSRTLKNLGDFQRSIQISISDLQERLGISRKTRKDRQADDFPAYVKLIQKKAVDFWQRKTVPVTCEKCHIELARFWLNFPDNVDVAHFEIACEKCKEKVVYSF